MDQMERTRERRNVQKLASKSSAAYVLAKGVTTLLGGLFGFWLSNALHNAAILEGPLNIVYLSILGLLVGYLVSTPHRQSG